MNLLTGLTGSASGGMTIAPDALGEIYMRRAAEQGIDPAPLHRVRWSARAGAGPGTSPSPETRSIR